MCAEDSGFSSSAYFAEAEYASSVQSQVYSLEDKLEDAKIGIAELLIDWVDAQCKVLAEFSGNFVQDWRDLIQKARDRAERLEVPWDDSFVPADVWENLSNYNEEE